MSAPQQLTIHQQPGTLHYAVTLDGHDIADQISGLALAITPGRPPAISLEMRIIRDELHVDTAAAIHLDEQTHDLLTRLGWTPPTTDRPARPDRFEPTHTDPAIHTR
jgi:hypothetical protein